MQRILYRNSACIAYLFVHLVKNRIFRRKNEVRHLLCCSSDASLGQDIVDQTGRTHCFCLERRSHAAAALGSPINLSRARLQTKASRMNLRRQFDTLRRPFGFNFVHYLLIDFYNGSSASSTLIKTYPLYPVFVRLQRKLHLDTPDENVEGASMLVETLISILSENDQSLSETVEQTHLNLYTYPIACLFRLYSPMHLLLFMEPLLIFDNVDRLRQIIRGVFVREYPKEKCDYIHFCIAHRKTGLIVDLLGATDERWLSEKINTPSDRAWLPIHYVRGVRRRHSSSEEDLI